MRSTQRSNDLAAIEAELRAHVDALAGDIGVRHLERPESVVATLAHITTALEAARYAVQRETFDVDGDTATNLIAELPGRETRDGEPADDVVILGAHHDTVWTSPGADDNASAVAMLLAAARLLRSETPRRTIRFVAFACEEMPYFAAGLMGSQIHARGCRDRGENVRAMVCLESVGYFVDEPRSQHVPPMIPRRLRWLFPSRGNFLASVANVRSAGMNWTFRRGFKRASRCRLFSIALPEAIPEIHFSDHRGFWEANYPAIMLTDTAFLRNPNYHEPTDTPETLDYARMAEATLGVVGGMRRLAG